MRYALLLTFGLFAVCSPMPKPAPTTAPATPVKPAREWTPAMQTIAEGNNQFVCDLFAEMRKESGNLFFSPFSIHTALAMTADGARGATLDEMVKVLHLPKDADARLATGDVSRYYAAGGDGYELAVSNHLWGQQGFPWNADFLERQKSHYGAGLTPLDFIDPTNREAARQTINAAIEKATKDKIKELLKKEPPDLDYWTRLVMTNAIYFKSAWEWNFNKRATHEAPFTLSDGTKKNVPLMSRKLSTYSYMETNEFQAIELPYKGNETSMVTFLPRMSNGLPALEVNLSAANLSEWIKAMKPQRTDLYLPRFGYESRFQLKEVLSRKMGMRLAFDRVEADLTGMAPTTAAGNLYVDKVIHQSFVNVNEDGTEAAAATVVKDSVYVMLRESTVFRADHPFLYLIRDTRTGNVLFLGRYAGP